MITHPCIVSQIAREHRRRLLADSGQQQLRRQHPPVPAVPGTAELAHALFASALQRSDEPSATQVRQAIAAAIRQYSSLGCVARVAQAYGENPEAAVTRMRWARATVAGAMTGAR